MTEAVNVESNEPTAANNAELETNFSDLTGGKRRKKGSKKKRKNSNKSSSNSSRKNSRKGSGKKRSAKKGSKKRGPSKWIAHVKAYRKQHNMTFPEALKDPNCSKAFRR